MDRRKQLDALCIDMTEFFGPDAKRIQHFLKVSSFAALIGRGENLDEHTLFILEAVGYVHDIGIKIAEQQLGYQNGDLQEKLGPDAARPLLEKNGFSKDDTERICWLIAHHHTYDSIDADDYRILVEADFLVNLYEQGASKETAQNAYNNVFRTETGKKLCRTMFL